MFLIFTMSPLKRWENWKPGFPVRPSSPQDNFEGIAFPSLWGRPSAHHASISSHLSRMSGLQQKGMCEPRPSLHLFPGAMSEAQESQRLSLEKYANEDTARLTSGCTQLPPCLPAEDSLCLMWVDSGQESLIPQLQESPGDRAHSLQHIWAYMCVHVAVCAPSVVQ